MGPADCEPDERVELTELYHEFVALARRLRSAARQSGGGRSAHLAYAAGVVAGRVAVVLDQACALDRRPLLGAAALVDAAVGDLMRQVEAAQRPDDEPPARGGGGRFVLALRVDLEAADAQAALDAVAAGLGRCLAGEAQWKVEAIRPASGPAPPVAASPSC